ncbi:MAG TPA: hypothetical protein PKI72_15895, partial [Giesbergeria sp.]|nr:hypothetical protein [Giesbergeria sp.]
GCGRCNHQAAPTAAARATTAMREVERFKTDGETARAPQRRRPSQNVASWCEACAPQRPVDGRRSHQKQELLALDIKGFQPYFYLKPLHDVREQLLFLMSDQTKPC